MFKTFSSGYLSYHREMRKSVAGQKTLGSALPTPKNEYAREQSSNFRGYGGPRHSEDRVHNVAAHGCTGAENCSVA
jgi:hypothetical protein